MPPCVLASGIVSDALWYGMVEVCKGKPVVWYGMVPTVYLSGIVSDALWLLPIPGYHRVGL